MRFFFFLFFTFQLLSFVSTAQNAKVSTAIEKTAMFIGDQTVLSLTIDVAEHIKVTPIDWKKIEQNKWEVISEEPLELVNANKRKASAVITTFELGELVIPPIAICMSIDKEYNDTIYSDSIRMMIYPVAPDSTGLAPIKDIIIEQKDFSDYQWYVFGVLLVLAALGYGMYWKQNQLRKEAILYQNEQNNAKKALRKLEQLEQQKLIEKGKKKEFCTELTYILREYLANEYQFNALKMTTSEIISFCKKEMILEEQWFDLEKILNISDYIKFAEGEAENTFFANALDDAKKLIV
jgi:TRAP-type mannitol/chloroaromatic compound transport system permease small subunit